jgi:hypothetical protein
MGTNRALGVGLHSLRCATSLSYLGGVEHGIEQDGPIIIRHSSVAITLGIIGVAAIVEGGRVTRIDPDCLVIICNGAVTVAFGIIDIRPIIEGV